MNELLSKLNIQKDLFAQIKNGLNLSEKKSKIESLEKESSSENFWKNDRKAKKIMQQLSSLQQEVHTAQSLEKDLSELGEIIGLADEVEDKQLLQEAESSLKSLAKKIKKLEISLYLSGKFDRGDAILSIHSGQGGTEAMDWAEMLKRMYIKYFEGNENTSYKQIEETRGEEAGIKSCTFFVSGPFSFGYLKNEAGTHRLVRLSPFNADNLRQTSFALVEVLPHIEENVEDIDISDEDLEWQFFKSGGKGGQNVNKVSTAVRLKHTPSGIIVESQAERHQEQNRKIALSLLRGKLWHIEEEKRKKTLDSMKGQKIASWGTQIRSYVLHPYKMVKDLRTNVETSDTQGVLDGKIEKFIKAEVKLK
ncbi:peptide chain release factor 2 [Patescibacteria group bacterium]